MSLFERPEKKTDSSNSNYKSLVLKVSGMHCEGCSENIQKSLSKINGLRNIQPNFINGEVKMEFDESKENLEKIRGAIRKAGFIAGGVGGVEHIG